MEFTLKQLHPYFVAEVSGADLRQLHDQEALERIRAGMDQYAVLVFRNQPFTNKEQLAFAQRFDGGKVHTGGVSAVSFKENRHGYDGFSDVSNVTAKGEIMAIDDPSTPEEFAAFIKSDSARIAKVIKDAGIKID